MADIYSPEWYASLQALINGRDDLARRVPKEAWRILVQVEGDGLSPYVQQGRARCFLVLVAQGKCTACQELEGPPASRELDFRFRGPASVFEGIAAGLVDPVEAGLKGLIKITGDMRALLRHADLVTEVLQIYMQEVETVWPRGKPPYGRQAGQPAGRTGGGPERA